jgi:chromosome segregation ATPase
MYRQVKSRLDALDNRLSFSVMRMRWSATKGASRKLLVESSKREEAQAIQLMRKELDSVRQERDAALRRLASEDELLSSVVSDRLQRLKSMFSAEIDEKDRRIVQITGDLRDREAGLEAARKEIAQLTELVMRLRSEASRREHDVQQAQGELLRVRSASEDRVHAEAAQFKEKITQLEEQLRNVTKELGKKNALLRNSDREKEKLADAVRELRKERSTLMSSLRQVQAVEKGARLSPTSSMPKQAEKLSSIARLASRLLSSDEDSSAEEDESDEHVGYG